MRTFGSGFQPPESPAGFQRSLRKTAMHEGAPAYAVLRQHSCYVRRPSLDGKPRPAWVSGPFLRFATALKRNKLRLDHIQRPHFSLLLTSNPENWHSSSPSGLCPTTLSTLVVDHLVDNSRTSLPVGSSIGPTDGAQLAGTLLSCKTGRLMAHQSPKAAHPAPKMADRLKIVANDFPMALRALGRTCASECPSQLDCFAACGEVDARRQLIRTLRSHAYQRGGPFTHMANLGQSGAEPG